MLTSREQAFAIGRLIVAHRGSDVTVLDLAEHSGWTDFFVIATAVSSTQLRSLSRFISEWAHHAALDIRGAASIADDEEWVLLDLGNVVVHLMSERSRAFYELEKLWFQAEATRITVPAAGAPIA